jgi:hypothetical protein
MEVKRLLQVLPSNWCQQLLIQPFILATSATSK